MGLDNRPISRKDDLVVQELNGEVLIYDLRENKAFCLNETSALVWQACDGNRTAGDIGKQLGNEDMVWLALDDLKREKLVEHELATPAKYNGMSRRQVISKIAMGSMLALPVIASLTAPAAAQTGSCIGMCGQTLICPSVPGCMCSNNSSTNNGTCGV